MKNSRVSELKGVANLLKVEFRIFAFFFKFSILRKNIIHFLQFFSGYSSSNLPPFFPTTIINTSTLVANSFHDDIGII